MCASHTYFKGWKCPGTQQLGSSKHTVDKGPGDKAEGRELSLGHHSHHSHPGKSGFFFPTTSLKSIFHAFVAQLLSPLMVSFS